MEFQNNCFLPRTILFLIANRADPDEMLCSVAFHLSLHSNYLPEVFSGFHSIPG